MKEQDIISVTLENLERNLNIQGNWQPNPKLDGRIRLCIDDKTITLDAEVKREIRSHHLEQIRHLAAQFPYLIIVANTIPPKIKEQLRLDNIAYAETNGNIYLKYNNIFLWVEGNKPLALQKEQGNRAFTRTGLKVIFHFLQDENSINLPYRDIASLCKVGLGNVNKIMNGLKEENFVATLGKHRYKLVNKKGLLEKWLTGYAERLQPTLAIGTFLSTRENAVQWKDIPLHTECTLWGGEPAAALLTGYLKPSLLTLYTLESRIELIKNYKLLPDPAGNVKAYTMFWQYTPHGNTVPPLLVYTDLMNSNEPRCIETAKLIYDEYLEDKF